MPSSILWWSLWCILLGGGGGGGVAAAVVVVLCLIPWKVLHRSSSIEQRVEDR